VFKRVSLAALILLLAFTAFPALAARDRTAPTRPTNLRVTAVTSYSVTLAWNASTDNSGQLSYIICCAYNNSATVPQTSTSFTFTAGVEAGRTFTFQVWARDAAGNTSQASNSVTVTTPSDTQPPAQPVVNVTEIGPTHIKLALSTVEAGPVWYSVFLNGNLVINTTSSATPTLTLLQPSTSYTITARARDFAGNLSPLSTPVTVTTAAAPNDTVPPTKPGNLSGDNFDEEVNLSWVQSTDNLTQQSLIKYEIYVNGVLDHVVVGRGRTVLYGTAGMVNTFEVIAVDTAGNKSAAATFVVSL